MEVKGEIAHLLAARTAGGKASLPQEGGRVSALVERYLGKGRWLLRFNGMAVEARSHLSLQPGQRIRATVVRRGGSVLLVARKGAGPSVPAAGAGDIGGQSRLLASLLLSAGAPARPALLERLAAALRRRSGRPGGPRLDAEAVSRGFQELPEEMEALVPGVDGEGRSGGGFSGTPEKDAGGGQKDRRESAGTRLARAAVRKSPRGDHPIQLYNHRALFGSGWVALPLGFTASEPRGGPESDFSGLLHVYLPEPTRWTLDLSGEGYSYRVVCEKNSVEISVDENGPLGEEGPVAGSREPGTSKAPSREVAAREASLRGLLIAAGFEARIANVPFDGITFQNHSNLQDGVDLLQ